MENNFLATSTKVAFSLHDFYVLLKERLSFEFSEADFNSKAVEILQKQGFSQCEIDREILLRQVLAASFKRGSPSTLAPSLFDCSGLVRYVYAEHGIALPRRSVQILDSYSDCLLHDSKYCFGDILFFKGYHERKPYALSLQPVGHVAFALDETNLVQITRKYGAKIHKISEFSQERELRYAMRIVDFDSIAVFQHPVDLEIRETSDVFWILHDVFAGWIKSTRKK